jgi:membrane protease YdiL (CAAX protease family)
MALFGLIGVGWLARRHLGVTLRRLGIVAPTIGQVLLGIGLALALLPTVLLIEYLGQTLGWGDNQAVEDLTEQLLGPLFKSPWGVITVGAAAALGEETLLRGAVQPRFGLWLTSIIFALLHTNYGFSISTVIVLGLGLLLGVIRMRTNTTTAMIVHGVYNSTLALLVYLNVPV